MNEKKEYRIIQKQYHELLITKTKEIENEKNEWKKEAINCQDEI